MSQYGIVGFWLHLEFTDGSTITMQNDGRAPEQQAKEQIRQIDQLGLTVRTVNIDDADIMKGKMCCFGCKRCPTNFSMYVIGGIVFSLIYIGLWFLIAYRIDGDEILFKT
jgi:hypothetical protein